MKRHFIILTLICLLLAPATALTPSAGARSPEIHIIGDRGYIGIGSDGDIHFVITSDGFRYYDVPSYGYCVRHHRSHNCRYVCPKSYKHYKKQLKKQRKQREKYYKKHYKKHHHHHDYDDDDD